VFRRAIQRSTIVVVALAIAASAGSAGLAAGLANPVSTAAQSAEEPTTATALEARVKELLAWVADKTGYSTDCVKVTVLFVAPSTINLLVFGPEPTNQTTVESLAVGSTIFLPTWFKLGEHDDILVHELTHVLQYQNNARFSCAADQEREAYITAAAFSNETGIGVTPSLLFMSQLRCNPY
jgi:hypothetical protein